MQVPIAKYTQIGVFGYSSHSKNEKAETMSHGLGQQGKFMKNTIDNKQRNLPYIPDANG